MKKLSVLEIQTMMVRTFLRLIPYTQGRFGRALWKLLVNRSRVAHKERNIGDTSIVFIGSV